MRTVARGGAPRAGARDNRPSWGVLLAIGAVTLLGGLLAAPAAKRLEFLSYDARMRLRHRVAPQPPLPQIVIVGIGEDDHALGGIDFARRQAHIDLLNAAANAGAKVVAFDIFFEDERELDDLLAHAIGGIPTVLGCRFRTSAPPSIEPSRQAPEDIAKLRATIAAASDGKALGRLLLDTIRPYREQLLTAHDAARNAPAGSPAAASLAEVSLRLAWMNVARREALERLYWLEGGRDRGTAPGGKPPVAGRYSPLSPPLLAASPGAGFANIEKGTEDVVRHAPLVLEWNGRLFPSLSLATALRLHGTAWSEARISWGDTIEFDSHTSPGARIRIPIDEAGRYLVNFRGAEEHLNTQPTISQIIAPTYGPSGGKVGADRLVGAVVLVGEVITAGEGTDIEPIPLQAAYPMVGLHANVLDNILRGDYLRVAPAWTAHLIAAALLLAGAVLFRLREVRGTALLLVAALVLYVAGAAASFIGANLVLPVAVPLVCAIAGWGAMGAHAWGAAERDRRLVREVFGKAVSPRIGEEILSRIEDPDLWGSERTITVLFVDIRGYTTLSEGAEPAVLLATLDRFYDVVSECVFRQDGQVNKFLGDAVLALFGALPEEGPNHAERAIRAAAEIQRRMAGIGASSGSGLRLRTGAGINTGPATVGIVGRRETRFEYTAIGDSVNVASRLQGQAAEGQCALGGEVVAAVGGPNAPVFAELGLALAAAGEVSVKGRRQPVEVFIAEPKERGA